jgi:hypothetical protein
MYFIHSITELTDKRMSKIIYYIGAGASYGKREILSNDTSEKESVITEGLPIVSEIPSRMQKFRKFIESAVIDLQETYIFKGTYNIIGSEIERKRQDMLLDIEDLYKGIIEHATIDTYAKKLFLTRRYDQFKKLKGILCAYFVWEQLDHKADQRYDTFLANVLSMRNVYLPENISVVSWNYDSQFELTYRYYTKNGSFPVFDKNSDIDWSKVPNYGCIFKVNGSATFMNMSVVNNILADDKLPKDIQLIMFYEDSKVDTSQLGYQFRPHLSFAWEETKNHEKMMNAIKAKTQDTEVVVVIGYSFPFFNRDVDRAIFTNMPRLKKIYIQDISPKTVETALKAVLSEDAKIKIEHIDNCAQFHIPREL